jgi:SpoIID/LytB domain protein
VLVAAGTRVTLGATAPWQVADASGNKTALPVAAPLTLRPSLAIAGAPLTGPLTITSSRPLLVNGQPFRGRLTVLSDGKALQVVDTLGLEPYVKGVVAAEMPKTWPAAALEAQAVAARSYAIANLQKGGAFDLFADGRSQNYGGVALETPATNAAVDATRGKVVLWQGKVADTLYSSSSGGRTTSAEAVLGQNLPYLAPVADPYDSLSPYHDWGPIVVAGTAAARALKVRSMVEGLQLTDDAEGRVSALTAFGMLESQVTLTGSQARLALALPSMWFTSSLLSLLPTSQAVSFGGAVTLTGFLHAGAAEPAGGVSLEAKSLGTGWLPAGPVALDSTGAFAATVSPQLSTQYRLAWGDVRAGLAKIAVSPVVTATPAAGAISGSVQPAVVGAAVELQRQDSTAWTTVSSTATDTTGAWSFVGTLAAGTYRVRCAPGHGLAPGLSTPVVVQ